MLDQRTDWQTLTPAEKVEAVRPLVVQGLSAAEIAAQFRGITRNSIISLCRRAGMQLGQNRPKPPPQVKKPHGNRGQPKANAIVAKVQRIRSLPVKVEPLADIDDGVDVTHLVGLLDLGRHSCRWPMTGEGSGTLFCGVHSDHGPYCDEHSARAGIGYGRGPRP